jgi:hypothetical protein
VHVHHIWAEPIDPFTEVGGHGSIPDRRHRLFDGSVGYIGGRALNILLDFMAGTGENLSLLIHDLVGTASRGMSIVELKDLQG